MPLARDCLGASHERLSGVLNATITSEPEHMHYARYPGKAVITQARGRLCIEKPLCKVLRVTHTSGFMLPPYAVWRACLDMGRC